MNHAELVMRRRNVLEFIKADAIRVIFNRPGDIVKTEAGGKVRAPSTPIGAPDGQRVRIVLNKRRFNPGLVNSEAGEIPHTDYLLLGTHTLDAQKDDTFQWLGENYHIVGIYGARTESFLASIDLLGKDNR